MTKTHKDIAVFMVQLAENESLSEQQVVREIADKTRELLRQLRSVFWCFCIWLFELSGVQNTHKYLDTSVQRWQSVCIHLYKDDRVCAYICTKMTVCAYTSRQKSDQEADMRCSPGCG